MGALCSCGTGETSSDKDIKPKPRIVSESEKTGPSDLPRPTADIHSSEELLDDHLKTEITNSIDQYVATLPSAYQVSDCLKRLFVVVCKQLTRLNVSGLSAK